MIAADLLSRAPVQLDPSLYEVLAATYAQPPRAYHSLTHVEEVLQHFYDVQARLGWQQPKEVFAALLFHDAIYVAGAKDNEAKSAELAQRLLAKTGLDTARVAHLIALTARHGKLTAADLDRDAGLFVDCDMAILGSSPQRFAEYDAAIAEEYRGAVNAMLYRIGRDRFLKRLLEAPRLYFSDDFEQRLGPPARRNLAATLKRPAP